MRWIKSSRIRLTKQRINPKKYLIGLNVRLRSFKGYSSVGLIMQKRHLVKILQERIIRKLQVILHNSLIHKKKHILVILLKPRNLLFLMIIRKRSKMGQQILRRSSRKLPTMVIKLLQIISITIRLTMIKQSNLLLLLKKQLKRNSTFRSKKPHKRSNYLKIALTYQIRRLTMQSVRRLRIN